jgi:hypothetical protein
MTKRGVAVLVLWGALLPNVVLAQSKTSAKSAKPTAAQPAEAAKTEGQGPKTAEPEAEAPQSTEAQPQTREKALSGSKSATSVQGSVKVQENKEGEKSYTFGALELEGRLKSPQILYFLRRVRAQFDPSGLGHRSFLRELADTRRHRAVR